MGWNKSGREVEGKAGEGRGQLGYGVNQRRTTSGLIVLVLVLVLLLYELYELYELYDRVYFSQLQAVRGMQPHGDPRCSLLYADQNYNSDERAIWTRAYSFHLLR